MGIRLSADDLLGVAEAMEANGQRFYRAAAAAVADRGVSALLEELAAWEVGHEATFREMRAGLTPSEREATAWDPDDVGAQYLQAMAGSAVFPTGADPLVVLGPSPAAEAVLRYALSREQESIAFYTGLQGYLPGRLGGARLQAVVDEERTHVRMLAERMRG